MTSILQDFTSNTSLSDNFTQSSPAAGTFTWGSNVGLDSAEGISVSLGSDQIWTTQQGYTISESGEYSISAFFQSSANGGYGALGFSIQGQDSNAGNYGAPDGSHIGAFFHGGGGGFLNNGAITNSGAASGSDSPISWSNGGVKSDGSWYNFIFTTKANGSNKYDLSLKIFNSAADGTVGSLVTAHSLTDDMTDSTREGPAITNANVGGANTLHTFFSAQGSRMTSIDDFLIDLEGDSLILQPGAPTVDLNGSADALNNTATFTEVVGVDDGSAAVSFTAGASNLGDLDSLNLSNLKVSLPTSESTSGDELLLGATQIDITGTAAIGEVTYNSTVFSYAIADASGTRTVTFASLDGIGGVDTAAPIASYEALLDAIKFNNTSDSPAANPTRTFSVTATDSDNNVSDTATFTVTAVNVGPQLNYDTTTFAEAGANDGSIGNSITITLQEDIFSGTNGDSLGAVSNVPDGLTAALTRASDTTATLSLSGNATAHLDTDNVTNLTVTFSDTDFANSAAPGVGNSTTSNIIIDYVDASNANNPVIKGKASASIDQNTATNINGFIISDDDNPASLTVKIAADHGTLALSTTTGIAGTTSGSTLQFSGSIADLNTALNSVAYQSDLNYVGQDDLIIQVSDDNGVHWHDYFVDEVGKFFYQTNEHYYEFVSAPGITWTDAKAAAEAKTLYGLNGYLTTVTSAAENNFIAPKLGGQGWMGASDAITEGAWFWETGPEAGTQFWSGTGSGSAVGGQYNSWASGEPNNSGGEDYAHFLSNGEWNDFKIDNSNITGYVVEYGGDGTGNDNFGTIQTVPLEITINDVNDAPALNNLDGDTVSVTVNQVAFLDTGTANSITDVDTTDFNTGTLVITTTSGTADGNFSLDGTNATAGGDSAIAANDSIVIGATTIGAVHATNDGQGGNTLTIILNGSATQANVSQLIQNIGYASASEGVRNFNLALSESDGKTANATLSIDIAIQSSGGSNTDNTSTSTVDGVFVKTSSDTSGGVTSSTTTVPIVEPTRSEDASTAHTTHADIPLATNNSDHTILKVSLPNGVGLTSQEILGAGSDTLRELLIAASDPKIEDAQIFDEILQKGIDAYVETVSDESQVTLRTITFVADDVVPEQPIIVTGALGTGEDNLENPLRQEALVIDARNLPSGTELQFDDIEFAIIMGSGRVVGGHGRNFVIGDDANQFIVLGEADDLLRGGGGDDIIGSQDGDDQLFGDAGDDYLFGGADNDTLDGGEGHDWLQGSRSDAGRWVFSLNEENEVLSTFTADEPVLSFDSFTTNWFSGNKPITNDSRVAFVYRDSGQLESIATLHQAVLHRLPSTEEMNAWSQQNLSVLQLGEFAYQAYVDLNGDMQTLSQEAQITQLLTDVWGADQVSNDWISQGIDYLNNGGNWGEVLSFIAHHDNLTEDLLDDDGDLQLTQDLQTSELGWSSDSGDDTLIGGDGDDSLVGGYGHNYLDGGVGHDVAIMVETADVHHILINNVGRISVQRKDLTAINDLIDVEKITFSDKTLDVNASNLDVAVLKNVAALAHLIDKSALTLANLNQVEDSAMTTTDVAATLMLTDSYSQNWASLSNHDFTSKLSETVLGSALTGDDLSFWANQIDQNTFGRDDLLVVAVGVSDFQDTLFAGDGLLLL